jgi:hypothetical protein
MDGPLHVTADHEPDLETAEEREKFYQEVYIAAPTLETSTHPLTSWSKPELLSVKGLLPKAKWTTL